MAIETVKFRVCDLCGKKPATRYRVTAMDGGQKLGLIDLCDDDEKPILDMFAKRKNPRVKRQAVTPLKDITAVAKPTKKAAPKKR